MQLILLRSSELGHELNNAADILMSFYYIMPLKWLLCVMVRGAVVSLDDVVEFIYGHGQGTLGAFKLSGVSKALAARNNSKHQPKCANDYGYKAGTIWSLSSYGAWGQG